MTKEKRETNPEVRQNRTPGEASRRNHHRKSKNDERAAAVTTQESSDGVREKAMRIKNIDVLETGSCTAIWSSSGGAENRMETRELEQLAELEGPKPCF